MPARASVFHDEYRRQFEPISETWAIAANADPSQAGVIAGKTGFAIVITRITFNVITSAAATLTVRDDNNPIRSAAVFPASPGVGTRQISYEPQGLEMNFEKSLDVAASGAGNAGTLVVEGYYLPLGPRTSL